MHKAELEARYRDNVSYTRIFKQLGYPRALRNPFYDRIDLHSDPKQPSTILDCGCGSGNDVRRFSVLGFHAVGVDINPYNIELGFDFYCDREKMKGKFVVSDCSVLPFRAETFKYAHSGGLIHCFSSKDQIKANLSETGRVLEKNGVLLGRTHGAEHSLHSGRLFLLSEQELRDTLAETGFECIETEKREFRTDSWNNDDGTPKPDFVLFFFAKSAIY